jgi:rhodanese-related sulfurtransferase
MVRIVSTLDVADRSADHMLPDKTGVSIDMLLEHARRSLIRLEPAEAYRAVASGAILVDIRPLEQRERDGTVPGALVIDRNVLEWRLDPISDFRERSVGSQQPVLIICNEGYSSSLADDAASPRSGCHRCDRRLSELVPDWPSSGALNRILS